MKHIVFVIAMFVLVSGCASPNLKPVEEGLLVNDDEKMLWLQALEEQKVLNTSAVIYHAPELEKYLTSIVHKLQPDDLPADLSFKIIVIKDPYMNAFAFPNVVSYIHTVILARMDNEAQLAALLAHEMSHCTQRHTLRAYRHFRDKPGFIASLQETLARLAMVEELARLLGLTGSMGAVSGYTRELESEADLSGLDYLVTADYDPHEALRLFEHLKKDIEAVQGKEPYFFGTHPKVQARIDNVEHLLETKYAHINGGAKNGDLFSSKVSQAVLENARLELRIGRFSAAQKSVEKYLRVHKNDASAYYLMGEIFRQRGQEQDAGRALGYYQKAIAMDSSYAQPHKAIGLIHYKQGQKVLAKKFFESSLLLAPNTPDKAYIQGYIKQCVAEGEG